MSDRMTLIPFDKMVDWVLEEYKTKASIFGIHSGKFYRNKSEKSIELFGDKLSSALGPAAGPNSQLAQNIVASYLTGCRFIELKTVQILDGEDLPVSKPCINAQDEGYNVEWSTELRIPDAYDEYVRAWFLLHLLMKELKLSDSRDFMFNMSVGYDLSGIKSEKINNFIEGMRNASETKVWKDCMNTLKAKMSQFEIFNGKDLEAISPVICPSITLSTLHGCPPQEIERIATYLLTEKKLHTFIKMNPTILGETFVRNTLDKLGYEYITLNAHHFVNDLQYKDGVEMLKRLRELAAKLNLKMGVKLTNTLPVRIENEELPGEEMYMSGRSLYALSIEIASRLADEFKGDIMVSYAGGADFFNVDKILKTGIMPVTFATTILKPGGYERITQMAEKTEKYLNGGFKGLDVDMLKKLTKSASSDKYYKKNLRPVASRKITSKLPLFDCYIAPCTVGCPINQQIPEYVSLVGEKKFDEAFKIIAIDNAAPAITGVICSHPCQYKCTRLDYEESVRIRGMKKIASDNSQASFTKSAKVVPVSSKNKVAIIGAGVAGLATAFYLRRMGMDVTVMDKKEKPFGVIEYIIPEFRIPNETIKKDLDMILKSGIELKLGVKEDLKVEELKKDHKYVVIATGAWEKGSLRLSAGSEKTMNSLVFLESFKNEKGSLNLGKNVCIVGGGDVAMDCARAAKRCKGVENVTIVYRRTKGLMPASIEELNDAMAEGIPVKELHSPVSFEKGTLVCDLMKLGEKDASGRRSPISTGKNINLDADTVIVAVGEKIDSQFMVDNKIELTERSFPKINSSNETNISNVFVAGDCRKGPSTIVQAMADGKAIAMDILKKEGLESGFVLAPIEMNESEIYSKKGILADPVENQKEADRCLSCSYVCEICVDVCPNRANVVVKLGDEHQIVHIDGMCNECGNCGIFCPYDGLPYKDKLTLFGKEADFIDSKNAGFMSLNKSGTEFKIRDEEGKIFEFKMGQKNIISNKMEESIKSCFANYNFMV